MVRALYLDHLSAVITEYLGCQWPGKHCGGVDNADTIQGSSRHWIDLSVVRPAQRQTARRYQLVGTLHDIQIAVPRRAVGPRYVTNG